jgi:hypothetical protein
MVCDEETKKIKGVKVFFEGDEKVCTCVKNDYVLIYV